MGSRNKQILNFIKNDLKLLSEGNNSICPPVSTEEELVIDNKKYCENNVFNIKVLKITDFNKDFKDIYFRVEEIIFEETYNDDKVKAEEEIKLRKINEQIIEYYLKRIDLFKIKKIIIKKCFITDSLFLKYINNDKIYVEFYKTNIKEIDIYNIKNLVISGQEILTITIYNQLDNLHIEGNVDNISYMGTQIPSVKNLTLKNNNLSITTKHLSIKNLTLINIIGPEIDYENNDIFYSLRREGEIKINTISVTQTLEKFISYLISKDLIRIFIKVIYQNINIKNINYKIK